MPYKFNPLTRKFDYYKNATSSGTDNHASLSNLSYAASGHTGFEPAKGSDDNYVTDAEKAALHSAVSISGEDYLSLTGQAITTNPIDLDNLSATGTPSSNTFLRGDNSWAEVSAGSGGYAANVYMSDAANSIVGSYKNLSYTNDAATSTYSQSVTNTESLINTYLFGAAIATTVIDAGIWNATFHAKISNTANSSYIKVTIFKRTSGGVETDLFTMQSADIDSTDYITLSLSSYQSDFAVNATDVLGARVYVGTTSLASVTVYYQVGNGTPSYFNTPLALRHTQLRDLNGDSANVHVSSTEKTAITHSNRTALDAVSGTNTGDQTGGTPALTLGTANTAGTSTNFIRRDDTILVFDATALTAEAIGSTSSVGTAATAARRDHRHPMPSALTLLAGTGGGYAACSTAIGTAAKTLTLSNYSLVVGGTVGVTFTNGNSASNPTMNINSAGAKPIFYNGSAVGTIPAGFECVMLYDGTNYVIINPLATSATQQGIVELATDAETATGTDTTRAITPANLKSMIDTDGTLAANSDTKIATQKATKTYADTKIANSLVDAKGDIITATADNTPARLPVGNNNEKLIADSSTATGLKWATDFGSNSFIINETPSGLVNGSNTVFDTYQNYVANSLQVFRDGQLMKGAGNDYTETDSNTFTFTTAPATGTVLLVCYQTSANATANADTVDNKHAPAGDIVGTNDTQILTNKTLSTGVKLDANADGNITYHSIARQAIMNGNFDIWQRNTSFSAAGKTADRWQEWNNGAGGTLPTLTFSRIAITPGDIDGAFYGYRSNWNGTGSSLGNGAEQLTYTRIEHGTRFLAGKGNKVTLSFWAKSDIPNKRLGLRLTQNYGTGGSPSSQEWNTGYTITLTSNWTKYTITFTLTSIVGKTFGTNNDDYLELAIQKMWGSNMISRYNSGTAEGFGSAGFVDIAQVQLNLGEIALPFQPKTFEQELQDCMRYYEKSFAYSVAPADAAGTPNALCCVTTVASAYASIGMVYLKIPKRTIATPTLYNPLVSSTNKLVDINNSANRYSVSPTLPGEKCFLISGNGSTSIPAGMLVAIHWDYDTEL